MKKLITRRHFIKYMLSNATLLTMGNLAFSGQNLWLSAKNACPECHTPCDFLRPDFLFESQGFFESYCPNCGINLGTLKHDVKCDHYNYCRQEKLLRNEKGRSSRSICGVCFNVPFLSQKARHHTEKPGLNLSALNF
jgi:hypothetical protein